MSIKEIILRIIRRLGPLSRYCQARVRKQVLSNKARERLNRYHNKLSYPERVIFHSLYARAFAEIPPVSLEATWTVQLAGQAIKLPLRGEELWLHWDTAISVNGHDVEVKAFYEKLIQSAFCPRLFFDIGANYGTHSLVFIAAGVPTVTFEPNPACYPFFEEMLQLNGLEHKLQRVAMGDKPEVAQLVFPERGTWLGSIQQDYQTDMQARQEVKSIDVEVITLDQYVQESGQVPDFIKIDTEGFEINVLRGGRETLSKYELIVIFESNKAEERQLLQAELRALGYVLYDLHTLSQPLDEATFLSTRHDNFLAVKEGHPILRSISDFSYA